MFLLLFWVYYQSIQSATIQMDFNEQMTVIRQSLRAKRMAKDNRVRFVSPQKWRSIMIKCLERFQVKKIFDNNMVLDLCTIIDKIPEEKFVEATLNIQPFKPSFTNMSRKDQKQSRGTVNNIEQEESGHHVGMKYRQTITKFKHSVHQKLSHSDLQGKTQTYKKSMLEEMLSLVTEESTLTKQFEAKYHPYRKIIEHFLFLLQNKYKMIIDSKEEVDVQEIQEKLITDLHLLQEFIVKSSEPYLTIFKSQNSEEKEIFQVKLIAFIRQYVEKHNKINVSIRKIMRAACRKSKIMRFLIKEIPDIAQITDFQIPEKYRIDGCYVNTMSTLMELAETTNSITSLQKLRQIRVCLSKDLQQFYKGQKMPPKMQITADTQLEIMKFIVVKVKSFLCQIYAQLKYLEVVCGQQDMSYRFDDSSYMYAQLSVAFQALQQDHGEDKN